MIAELIDSFLGAFTGAAPSAANPEIKDVTTIDSSKEGAIKEATKPADVKPITETIDDTISNFLGLDKEQKEGMEAFSKTFSETLKEEQKLKSMSPAMQQVYRKQQTTEKLTKLFNGWGV